MRFERLTVDGFGRLRGQSFAFGEGLTLIAGPNEAGKSTMVECLLRTFFGYPDLQYQEQRRKYEPWASGSPYRATLAYRTDDGRAFEVVRDFARPDVPTETVEADTRRPVRELTGNRSASPGQLVLGMSLDVYRAAAVISADPPARDEEDAKRTLADHLAKIVASAGDESAAGAVERLKELSGKIGERGAGTPLGKARIDFERADEALRQYRSDYAGFEAQLEQRAQHESDLRELQRQRLSCTQALAAAQLHAIRAQIEASRDAASGMAQAQARRTALAAAPASVLANRQRVEDAMDEYRVATQSRAEALSRADGPAGDRVSLQHDVDAANAELLEKRAALSQLDRKIEENAAAAEGKPAVSSEDLIALESLDEQADRTESTARTLETQARFEHQHDRRAPTGALAAFAAAVVALGAGAIARIDWLELFGVLLFALAIGLVLAFASASSRHGRSVAAAVRAAATAKEEAERAAAALNERCRALGCADVAQVRAARNAQAQLDRLRAERAALADAATAIAGKRDALEKRLADAATVRSQTTDAVLRVDASTKSAMALFDELQIPPGNIDERFERFREMSEAGEHAARADADVERARADLERALAGKSLEWLEDRAGVLEPVAERHEAGGEFAQMSEEALAAELEQIGAALRSADNRLHAISGSVRAFEQLHPVPAADLEEAAAEALLQRQRYETAKAAAKIAWETIEAVKDAVHRDFTPQLNESAQRAMKQITSDRYADVWIDPKTFGLSVRTPETGGSKDAALLSTGTIGQLQFALRAALASALGAGERVPIVYDDALAHADDERSRRAIEFAAGMARSGMQILFFTPREQLAPFAEGIGAHVIRLSSPAA